MLEIKNMNAWAVEILEENLEEFTNEEKLSRLEDIVKHGCISGVVGQVIYTHDCHQYFKAYMSEILEAIDLYEEHTEYNPFKQEDFNLSELPVKAVWFIIEVVADAMIQELEEEEESLA